MNDDSNNAIKDTFQEPRKRFWLRSRKRPKSDAVSISSMDISLESEVGKKKKRRRITEVASNIFSSGIISNKHGNTLQSTFTIPSNSTELSFIENDSEMETLRKKRKDSIESTKNFVLKSWVSDIAKTNNKDRSSNFLSKKEVKRQEAIYELYCGENVLLNDLCILRDFYYEPLVPTGIFSSDELHTLFSSTSNLIEIHAKLRDELVKLRDQYGFTETIGPTILKWIPALTKPYLERCRTQIWAKHLLDEKRLSSKRLQSFLKKRLESPRALDLWTYIDVARTRIVKYPLLVKEILRHTPSTHSDQMLLKEAYGMLSKLLQDIDKTMGEAECKLARSKIHVKVDCDPMECIKNATELVTEGQLKDTRGMKFQCFLFDTGFAITRGTRSTNKKYNLVFPVIPKENICVDAEEKSFTTSGFKIGDYFLITEDGHGKRHWMDAFNKIHRHKITSFNATGSTIDRNEKENKISQSNGSSMINICENHFSQTLKKNLLKRKRNSIGYT